MKSPINRADSWSRYQGSTMSRNRWVSYDRSDNKVCRLKLVERAHEGGPNLNFNRTHRNSSRKTQKLMAVGLPSYVFIKMNPGRLSRMYRAAEILTGGLIKFLPAVSMLVSSHPSTGRLKLGSSSSSLGLYIGPVYAALVSYAYESLSERREI